MTTTATYPSAMVPGPPPVHLEMPEGWIQVWVPQTLLAIRDGARGADHFLASVVVRHHQRSAPFGREEILGELTEQASQRQHGEVGPPRSQVVGGREWVAAELTFVDPQAGGVAQTHWFTTEQQDHFVEVVQVTASRASSRRDVDDSTIDDIINSIRVRP